MKKELQVKQVGNGIRCYLDGAYLSVANAVKMIEGYCLNGADYELRAEVKIFESKVAKSLHAMKAAELSKVEWVARTRAYSKGYMVSTISGESYVIPRDGENGVEFIADEIKNAEIFAEEDMYLTIGDAAKAKTDEQKQVELKNLAELAKKYPQVYAKVLNHKKAFAIEHEEAANWSGLTALLPELEKIAAANEPVEEIIVEDDGSNEIFSQATTQALTKTKKMMTN